MDPVTGEIGFSAELAMAVIRSRQAEIVGEVLDESIERMAENRERRAEENRERGREEDRLRAIERRERADAESTARKLDQRGLYFDDLAGRGDEWAAHQADLARGDAEETRRTAERTRLDVRG